MALAGTEVLYVSQVLPGGAQSQALDPTTTQAIANLAVSPFGQTLVLYGATSGTTTITPQAIASGTLSLPAATDTLVGKATTDTLTNKTLVTPVLGAATGTSLAVSGAITSSGGKLGYATGAGGTVTQITSRATGVTLSKLSGTIQTDTTSLAFGAHATFTVTNTLVSIGDVVNVSIQSGANSGNTFVYVSTIAAGSFALTVYNASTATAETGAIIINFVVLKAVSA